MISYRLLPLLFLLAVSGLAQTPAPSTPPVDAPKAATTPEPPLNWHDVQTWGVEGRAWADLPRERWFDRFPAEAKGRVTDNVWSLSRDSTGMCVHFRTDADLIWVDFSLMKDPLTIQTMGTLGSSGVDLYARDATGRWRWASSGRPTSRNNRQMLITGVQPAWREYKLYLPIRNGTESLSIGVPPGARFEPVPPRTAKPIVFYGTSINHGSSASRAGMIHTAILGRRFDRPVVNLGFGGNGRMDAAVGELLVKIDAAVYVIDCLPNMNAALVRERCIPLVKQLRAARPHTPIVLVEDRRNANAWILPARNAHHTANHEALKECFAALQKEGVQGLFYIEGDGLIGDDSEGTTDASHPSDLGFMRQADAFEPILRAALGER